MEFYDATDAKKYARNKTRIIKEINDIEENIAQAVDENLFECDVYDTVMTDSRETAEPIREAKAHCVMELSKIVLTENEEIEETVENYFRIGEVLSSKDESLSQLEFKVSEINENGDIINLEIINRGEFDKEILDKTQLQYKDMDNWLDINSDFGLISDLKIDRNNNVFVKDLKNELTEDNEVTTEWFSINNVFTVDNLPSESFGVIPDAYIKNQNEIYIKTVDGWSLNNKIYDYVSFKMPLDFEEEGTVCYNVFGKNWVKTHCGWYVSPSIIDLGDLTNHPKANDFNTYDIVYYNIISIDNEGNIVGRTPYKVYKCCHNAWQPILKEVDWSEKPNDSFGNNLDLFIYPEGNYRVKINDSWDICPEEWRFDSIYLEDTFGNVHDVIVYTGEYEPYTTYVKMEASADYPNGHWKQVEKIWNLNEYLLGRLPIDAKLYWTIKNVIIDDKGDGYMYSTAIIFSEGDAVATVRIVNDKIVDIKLINGGDDYTLIPEINFVMEAPTMSKKYYQVWKQLLENDVLQDEMKQVMDYFESTKTYSISRVTNDLTGNTFYWHLQWN